MLCQFLLYSKVNQLYIHVYPLFFRFPSHLGHQRALSSVPYATQQALISYLFYISSIYTREGNGTLLQYSCLENPMDGGAWWAAVHEVSKSWTRLSDFTFRHWRRKWQPTPVFLPGESQGRGSLVGCLLWGRTESDMTEATQQQQQYIYINPNLPVHPTLPSPFGIHE